MPTYGPLQDDGTLTLRLLFDHRVYDGATAARVLARVEEILLGPIYEEIKSGLLLSLPPAQLRFQADDAKLSPALVCPHPLLGMVTYPGLDDGRHHLHRAIDVDFSFPIARGRQGFGYLEPVPAVRLPDDASTVNRAFKQARHPSEHRIDTTGSFEKGHVHAVRIVLVDEHADEATTPKRTPDPERRIESSWY